MPVSRLRAALFNVAYALYTAGLAIVWLPIFLGSGRIVLRIGRAWARGALFLARHMLGITYEMRGTGHVSNTQVIYASKHQSALDIAILMYHLRAPCFILKRELLFVPFFGMYLWRMRMVAINRKGKASAMKDMVNASRRALHELRPLVVFPEGTRIPPGEKGTYHPGIAALYDQLKIPVIPVAVNCGCFWPRESLTKYSGKAVLEFMEPIPPGLPPREFLRRLQNTIEDKSTALYAEAVQQKEPDHAPLQKTA